jgi:hypothetical protein
MICYQFSGYQLSVHSHEQQSAVLFPTESTPFLELTHLPMQYIPRALSREVKRQEREADHSPKSSVGINKLLITIPLLHTPSWHSA